MAALAYQANKNEFLKQTFYILLRVNWRVMGQLGDIFEIKYGFVASINGLIRANKV